MPPDPEIYEPETPWDQQLDEGPEAYEAFATYRDQGRDRSTRKVARTLGKSGSLIGEWSRRNGWVHRAAAYDRHLDGLRRRESEEKAVAMGARQSTQLQAGAQALMAPVQAMLQRITEARGRGQDPFAGMAMPALARLASMSVRHLPTVVEAERLVAGLSTENVRDGAPGSPEEARAQAERMDRPQLEEYLLGVDDGRARAYEELGVELDSLADAEGSAG